jgi:hypothetical protein
VSEHREQGDEHEAGAGQKVESDESNSQPFVGAGQTAESDCPGEAPLRDPASREKYEASFGFGVFHHFQLDATLFGGLRRSLARINLIEVRDLDVFAGQHLYLPGQLAPPGRDPVRWRESPAGPAGVPACPQRHGPCSLSSV